MNTLFSGLLPETHHDPDFPSFSQVEFEDEQQNKIMTKPGKDNSEKDLKGLPSLDPDNKPGK